MDIVLARLNIILNYFRNIYTYLISNKNKTQSKKIYFDIKEHKLERYYYSLLKSFNDANYTIYLLHHFKVICFFKQFGNKFFTLPNLKLKFFIDKNLQHKVITDNHASKYKNGIHINYDIYSNSNNSKFVFPFAISPETEKFINHETINSFRNRERKIKIFFSGNLDEKSYNNLHQRFNLMSRTETIKIATHHLKEKALEITDFNQLKQLLEAKYINKFVFTNWKWNPTDNFHLEARIPNNQWIETLSYCDFFLCCPGVSMPMSHNAIEAMAVGTIPLISYGEYFYPNLIDKINCVLYKDETDLKQALDYILNSKEEDLLTIRKNVIEYYNKHLNPSSFIKKFEQNTNINEIYLYAGKISEFINTNEKN